MNSPRPARPRPRTAYHPDDSAASPRAAAAAASVLERWFAENDRTPLDLIFSEITRGRRDLNSRERRWVSAAVFGTVRHLARQRGLLAPLGVQATPAALVRLWAESPAGSEEPVDASRLGPSPWNAEALASMVKLLPTRESPAAYLRVTQSFPERLASELEAQLGPEAVDAAEALNRQAPVCLRVNPLRSSRAKVLAALPDASPGRWSPWALELEDRQSLSTHPAYRSGEFDIQEEASQLAAIISAARPGETVVEIGAGAGGKTLALAALMQNRGRIVSVDTGPARLTELQRRCTRAGVTIATPCLVIAGRGGRWRRGGPDRTTGSGLLRTLRQRADCVFIDAPCSGSGVLRRSPDARWRSGDADKLRAVQASLLMQGAELVRPGGRLVYVTCAFERAQNEDVIEQFLRHTRDGARFRQIAAVDSLREGLRIAGSGDVAGLESFASGNWFRSWPHRHGIDAFCAAVLVREQQDPHAAEDGDGGDA